MFDSIVVGPIVYCVFVRRSFNAMIRLGFIFRSTIVSTICCRITEPNAFSRSIDSMKCGYLCASLILFCLSSMALLLAMFRKSATFFMFVSVDFLGQDPACDS